MLDITCPYFEIGTTVKWQWLILWQIAVDPRQTALINTILKSSIISYTRTKSTIDQIKKSPKPILTFIMKISYSIRWLE